MSIWFSLQGSRICPIKIVCAECTRPFTISNRCHGHGTPPWNITWLSLVFKKFKHKFILVHLSKYTCYFLVYMEDLVIIGSEPRFSNLLIHSLSSWFSLKDMGQLHIFLGMEVISTIVGLFLSYLKYICDVLSKTICLVLRISLLHCQQALL